MSYHSNHDKTDKQNSESTGESDLQQELPPDESSDQSSDGDSPADQSAGQRSDLPLSRRGALASLVGLGSLSLVGGSAQARHDGPHWNKDVDAEGNTLFDLGALAMRANPTDITDFEGTNLVIDDKGVLNVDDVVQTDIHDDGSLVVENAEILDFGANLAVSGSDATATVDADTWDTDVDADGHTLTGLGALATTANPTEITDFAGDNLSIDGNVLTAEGSPWADGDDDGLLELESGFEGIDLTDKSNGRVLADLVAGRSRVETPTIQAPAGTPLTLHTDAGTRALKLGVPGTDFFERTGGANVVAGHPDNSANDNVGATIGGGGSSGSLEINGSSRANTNEVRTDFATIAGGMNNRAGNPDPVSSQFPTVGGGRGNTAIGHSATVAGGGRNTANSADSTVAGGLDNSAVARYANVGGGRDNTASGQNATVSGGAENTASGIDSTVPGGRAGEAADSSSFVWNDFSGYHDLTHTDVEGLSSSKAVNGEPVTGRQTFSVSAKGGVRFITGDSSVTYISGGSTGWATTSTRAAKTNIDPVDPQAVLAGVEEMEVATWEYKDRDGDGQGVTHIGPMAEDFHEAVDVGDSDEYINSINADGVAFAAIQGLSRELDERDDRIDDLEAESERKDERIDVQQERIDELDRENEQLRERLATVEDRLAGLETGRSPASADD